MKRDLPRVGDLIDSKYEVVRRIGSGGTGIVYQVFHRRLEKTYAVKFLQPELMHLQDVAQRFEQEARATAKLENPHVVRMIDVARSEHGVPYLVMEFLSGRELGEELAAKGPLPLAEIVHWVSQACIGVQVAHRAGIVHRDLKLSNLFLHEQDGVRALKVLDFGISKVSDPVDPELSDTGIGLGTPSYMSPEQIRCTKHVDLRADIWSLGVILYRLATGRFPFERETASGLLAAVLLDDPDPPSKLRPDLPAAFDEIVLRAMNKEPGERFASADGLRVALAALCGVHNEDASRSAVPVGTLPLFSLPFSANDVRDLLAESDLNTPPPSESSPAPPLSPPSLAGRLRTVVLILGATAAAGVLAYVASQQMSKPSEPTGSAASSFQLTSPGGPSAVVPDAPEVPESPDRPAGPSTVNAAEGKNPARPTPEAPEPKPIGRRPKPGAASSAPPVGTAPAQENPPYL